MIYFLFVPRSASSFFVGMYECIVVMIIISAERKRRRFESSHHLDCPVSHSVSQSTGEAGWLLKPSIFFFTFFSLAGRIYPGNLAVAVNSSERASSVILDCLFSRLAGKFSSFRQFSLQVVCYCTPNRCALKSISC